jgi:hypothetical protein
MRVILYTVVILVFGLFVATKCVEVANAHDGLKGHDISQAFVSHFDSTHGVFCGWRHGYEGISCVSTK